MTQEEFQKRYQYNPNTDYLGEGGFGKVYKAYDTHRDRYVAIKMAEVKQNMEDVRLKREVEIISKLPTHPNVAHYEECYTFSTFTGEYDFGVLQYYEQGNLQQLLTDKQLSYDQKDSILKQILEGVVFLHSQGIIHRDLKPQNILIALSPNGVFIPKITDFGISKKLDVNKSSIFTNSLAGAGTLSFASPEQLLGNTIRKNTDLWSFGVITCWMFTGKLPFNTGNQTVTSEAGRIELFKQITAGDVTSIIQQLPADWRNLVRQCLVVDVEKRISGAGKCFEILSGKVEVPIENHKSENTSIITIVNSAATAIAIDNDYDENLFEIKGENGHCGFVDLQGRKITQTKYDFARLFCEGLAVVGLNGKYGYIDKHGREIIPLKYDLAYSFSEGIAVIFLTGIGCGYIDKQGKEITPLKYSYADSFSEGLALVWSGGKAGYIDKQGNEVTPIKYDLEFSLNDGAKRVSLNKKSGLINKQGKEITPLKYDEIYFPEGIGIGNVKLNNKYGYIDKQGKEITPLKYDTIDLFTEGLSAVSINSKYGYIDKQGREITSLKYDSADRFSEGLAVVELNGKSGYIDKQGREIIPLKFDIADSFNEGMAAVMVQGFFGEKLGFIDKQSQVIFYKKYGGAEYCAEGLWAVEKNGKYGFINKQGVEITSFKYDEADSFNEEEFAKVKLNDKYGLIDKQGNEFTQIKYDTIGAFIEGFARVKLNNKFGFIDKQGREITSIKFDEADSFNEGLASVKLNGKSGHIDKKGYFF